MAKNCPKCGSSLTPTNASYCIACESYIDVSSRTNKQKSGFMYRKTLCCSTTFSFVAVFVAIMIWGETPIGSEEELITEIFIIFFIYMLINCILIAVANGINSKIEAKSKRTKPGIDLSFLKAEKRIYSIPYYLFIIGIIILALTIPANYSSLLILLTFYTILFLASFFLTLLKFKRVKYWTEVRDIYAIITMFLIMMSLWSGEYFIYLIGLMGVIIWIIWFIVDVIKGRIEPIKLLGLLAFILIIGGLISNIQNSSYVFIEFITIYCRAKSNIFF